MRRIFSYFLCAVILFGLLPVIPAVSATTDTQIIADDFEGYGTATTVTNSVKGWDEFNARCHSLVTDGDNTYAKLARGLTSTGATENSPRARKNVAAVAGDIYMIQADVKVSEKGLLGIYARATNSLSLVRFGGNILLNGANTGYKTVKDQWLTFQLFFKMAENGDSMDVYLRLWGDGVTNSNGDAISASAPVMVSKTITSNLSLSANATTWLFFQGAFSSGTESDYAALDNVTIKKIGEELTDLSTLTVNGEEVPGFSPDKTTYDLELDYGTTEAIVAATAGTGKTVTIDCSTVTDFPRGVNITVTNDTLGISKTYTVNLTVSSTADFDLLLSDDFESYGTAEKVTNSIKGWSQITAASHSLVTDGDTRALKLALVGTEKSPRARKNITAQVGDTIQVQADFKLSENGYIGLYLRNNSKTESIHLLKNTDVLINGASTGYEIDPEKWFTCNTHVKLAANGGLMEIYMCLWGEGVVDREGNAATRENPVKLSRTVNTSLNVESVSTVTIDFGCNFSKGDETDYALVDNVIMTKLHSDVAGLTGLTVNETEVKAVEGTDNQFSIMLPFGTERAVVLAEAGYGRTVTVSESVVTKFPTDVTVAVENASAGVTKTYIVSVDAKRTENQMEGTLMLVYGGANGIFTMSYDDGLYETAAYLDQIGAKYDVYSSAMMIPSRLSKADRAKWQLLFDRGYVEPQNHSMTHLVLPGDSWIHANDGEGSENNTPENYQYQIVDSKDLLEEYFGNDIIFFAASNNTLSSGAWEVVKDSHYAARLGALGVNSLDPTEGTNPGQWQNLKCVWFSKDMEEIILPHIDIAAEQGGWFVGGCHSIGEFDRAGDVSVEDAERIFAYVSAYQEENKLWATTVSNAIKYVRERQNSRCYVDWVNGNVVVEVVSNGVLDKEIFDHALTVKAQIPAGWNQVKYTCNGEEFVADVFEEDGKYWAYINVLPDTRVVVRDARNYDVLFTENFDDLNTGLGDTFTTRGWNTVTNNSYLSYNGIIGEKDIQYTGAGTGDYYPRANAITEAKVGDTYVITGDVMRGAGATAYVYLYNAVANTSHAVFYINDNGVYFADSKMACTAVNDQWIHYEISVVLGENGEVCQASIVLYGGVKDASGNPITSSKPFTYSKNITMKAYNITENGALRVSFASKVNATTSYTRWDNMVLSTVKNDAVALNDLKINGESVENFYNTITQYDVKLDAAATITATAPEGCAVVIDKETVEQYPATVKVTVTKGTVSKVYTLNLTKKLSGEMDSEILPVYGGANSIVSMTFDDGYYDSLEILEQLLSTYDLQASAMMIAERINDSNVQQFKDLFAQGHIEPQNHSMTHLNLKDNDTAENYQTEILDAKTRLETYFGNDMLTFAAAYNVLSQGAWETVMDSHYAARLGAYGINSLDPENTTDAGGWYNLYNVPFKKTVTDQYSYLVHNLSRAAENGGWLVTMCHGVGAGTNSEISQETADALFAQIARMQEGGKVWNASMSDAVKYLRQVQNYTAHTQWIGGDVYVTLENTGITLPEDVFDHPLTVKAQVPDTWTQAVLSDNSRLDIFTENGKSYVYADVVPGKELRLTDSATQDTYANDLKFSGANVTLQSDMSVSFKVKASLFTDGGYTAPYAEFVQNGVKVRVDTYTVSGDTYLFTFRNIAPDKAGDMIYATLHATKDGTLWQGKTSEYSVAQYCYNMLPKTTDEMAAFRTLLVDLLNYASASQVYTGHNTGTLANRKLTDAQKLWGTQEDPSLTQTDLNREYTVVDGPTASWVGAALVLEDSVTMRLKLKTDSLDGLTVKITDGISTWTANATNLVQYEDGRYYLYFDGLHAGQMRQKVYFTVYRGDVAVSNTLQYSVASYAYSYQSADPAQYPGLAELVKAMMRYGDAAYNFAN